MRFTRFLCFVFLVVVPMSFFAVGTSAGLRLGVARFLVVAAVVRTRRGSGAAFSSQSMRAAGWELFGVHHLDPLVS